MAANQRILMSQIRFELRKKENELVKLKREIAALNEIVWNNDYINTARKKRLSEKRKDKLKHGQRNRKSKLKAALNGVQ